MASNAAYRGACIELFARLWSALDRIPPVGPAIPVAADADAPSWLEIVRIELILAIAACERLRNTSSLDRSQGRSVGAVVADVLAILERVEDGEGSAAIARAQNRLLDAVLEHCATGGIAATGARDRRTAC